MKDELVLCILAAFALDLLLGDPRWLPHPVRLVGWSAVGLEWLLTRVFGRNRFSGILFTLLIVGGSYAAVWGLIYGANRVDPRLALGASVYFLYAAFAARDLDVEASRVYRSLTEGDLEAARKNLSMIVGRDTERLDETEITRAAVETVAENTVDGEISPLFFALLGGAPAAIAFKAASTLDSMVGHRTERYVKFGWASARLDDVLNFIPARIARFLYPIASFLCGLSAGNCWRIIWRDGLKSPSPNAGISEAAVAGALGVRLGGVNTYEGMELARPYLGDSNRPLEPRDIRRSIRMMYAASLLMLALGVGIRMLVTQVYAGNLSRISGVIPGIHPGQSRLSRTVTPDSCAYPGYLPRIVGIIPVTHVALRPSAVTPVDSTPKHPAPPVDSCRITRSHRSIPAESPGPTGRFLPNHPVPSVDSCRITRSHRSILAESPGPTGRFLPNHPVPPVDSTPNHPFKPVDSTLIPDSWAYPGHLPRTVGLTPDAYPGQLGISRTLTPDSWAYPGYLPQIVGLIPDTYPGQLGLSRISMADLHISQWKL